jgi:hypothetical protein
MNFGFFNFPSLCWGGSFFKEKNPRQSAFSQSESACIGVLNQCQIKNLTPAITKDKPLNLYVKIIKSK